MKYFEDSKTELKRELIDDVKKEIIAFLNTKGGIIYVGVNDDEMAFLSLVYDPEVNNWNCIE